MFPLTEYHGSTSKTAENGDDNMRISETIGKEARRKIWLLYLRKSRQDDPNETVAEVLAKHEVPVSYTHLTLPTILRV